MLKIVQDEESRQEFGTTLDEVLRQGAQRMLAAALEAEADDYVSRFRGERDADGHAMVVRNGHARPRKLVAGAGVIEVEARRVNDKRIDPQTGERMRFSSVILPRYMRRSPKVAEVLPLLYLHGLSSLDFVPALKEFFGDTLGLSASAITRLTVSWQEERKAFSKRDLHDRDYVYIWVDGIHTKIRLGDDKKICCLVIVGVRADGTKELVAIEDGYRESTASWANLLRDCRRRGMRAPVLAIGDGALGFWSAVGDVFPETAHQRDWFHAASNILDCLPDSLQDKAREMLREIYQAEDRSHAEQAADRFIAEFEAKWPKATGKLVRDREELLAFYAYPAEHWIHLRTSNPIESVFAPVRWRTNITHGPGSKETGLAMIFKLIEAAQERWRKINAPHLVAFVRAGATFINGKLVEEEEGEGAA